MLLKTSEAFVECFCDKVFSFAPAFRVILTQSAAKAALTGVCNSDEAQSS